MLTFEKHITWFTTPKELRRMAKILEERMANACIGDDVPSIANYGAGDFRLIITADQDAFHNKEKGEWS